jgi:hypothetical protein
MVRSGGSPFPRKPEWTDGRRLSRYRAHQVEDRPPGSQASRSAKGPDQDNDFAPARQGYRGDPPGDRQGLALTNKRGASKACRWVTRGRAGQQPRRGRGVRQAARPRPARYQRFRHLPRIGGILISASYRVGQLRPRTAVVRPGPPGLPAARHGPDRRAGYLQDLPARKIVLPPLT